MKELRYSDGSLAPDQERVREIVEAIPESVDILVTAHVKRLQRQLDAAKAVIEAARPIVRVDEEGAYAMALGTSPGFEGWETAYPKLEEALERYDEATKG